MLKVGEVIYALVGETEDGKCVLTSHEGYFISGTREGVKEEMQYWRFMFGDELPYEDIIKLKLVEVGDEC